MSNNDDVRQRLLKEHSPTAVGKWKILGEDPNCDLGGYHHEPHIATVAGTYANVVEFALRQNGFFSWGGGGRIVKVFEPKVIDVDNMKDIVKIKELESEREKLQNRIYEIDEELTRLV